MNTFTTRSSDPELMDDLTAGGLAMDRTLNELDVINRWLGGNNVTIDGLSKLLSTTDRSRPLVITDIGCGSGEMTSLIAQWGQKAGRDLKLIGIDANPHIIRFAKEKCRTQSNISFEVMNVLEPEFTRQRSDVVVATLFMHHFTNHQLIGLFRILMNQSRIGFIVNDIHRHPIALHSIRWLTALFSKSQMVKNDAPLSVRRAFTRRDLETILSDAGITTYTLKWKWAFRWQLVVRSTEG
jgi:ubiquinone/menaquinone biosynthesis C-methylase UbiE